MAKSAIYQAIKMISDEKGLKMETVVETIEAALAAAYRKDFGELNQNIVVKFEPETGESEVYDVKTVVEDMTEEEIEEQKEQIREAREKGEEIDIKRYNPKTDLMISQAKEIKKSVKLGEEIWTKLEVPEEYGRMAAQTAKQVITQKLREAERLTVYEEFKEKEGEILVGVIQRREGRNVLVDLGKTIGIIPFEEQIPHEKYISGQRIKVYVLKVELTTKGPNVILSRAHEEIVKKLFTLEIPEIASGAIEIIAVAREAGSRTKIAVKAIDETIDPIGSCVGQRGTRVQTIINELGGEKIDIILYEEDSEAYITNALAPAKITSIKLDQEKKEADVKVAEDQLSLAIGKQGQNVRLAARLTGWKLNVISEEKKISSDEPISPDDLSKEYESEKAEEKVSEQDKQKKPEEKEPEQSEETAEKTDEEQGKQQPEDKHEEPAEEKSEQTEASAEVGEEEQPVKKKKYQ